MSWQTEFPDYDGEFHTLNGWEDNSWHNDTCPHLEKFASVDTTEIKTTIWQDYVDKDKREFDLNKRFTFQIHVNGILLFSAESDDWSDMLKYADNINDYEWKWN